MPVPFLLAAVIRWAGLAALATLVGSLVVDALVLPRARSEVGAVRGRLRRVGVICLIVLAGPPAGELVTRAQTMAGGDLAAALPAIPPVLTRTHFGAIWIGRFVLLALALLVSPLSSRAARAALLVLAMAVTLTTTLTGHAADWGDLTPSAAIDWVHVVSASAWTGGLLCLALCVLGPARRGAYVSREAVLVLLVFGCTAVLVDLTPARHADHARHQVALEPGPFRVTMEELHESGGVPPGWIFVPPAGDAAHGRQVFIR